MPQRKLRELDFMDLYVCLEGDGTAHYRKAVNGQLAELDTDVPADFNDDIQNLVTHLRTAFDGVEKGFTYEGLRLRASQIRTAANMLWVALRRIADHPIALEKLGFMPQLVPHLQKLGQRDGLILLCGSTGQGKTTTSSSLLINFLENYGGVAFTIEDPVEYVMEGRRGKSGFCYQVEIDKEEEWGEMLKRSLRWHPRYIFVGEIRTPDAANQLLRAATSGHLVITTMHAGTVEEALEGLLQLGEQALGDRAPLLLATGLTAVIHQTITPLGINARFVITEPHSPSAAVRAVIREKKIGQIRTFAEQQMSQLMQSGKIFRDQ